MDEIENAKRSAPTTMGDFVQWLWFMRQNQDYKAYCAAKGAGNSTERERLEATNPQLAEVFADWGDIHAFDLMTDSTAQRDWWRERHHLFSDHPLVRWIERPAEYKHRPGHLLVEMPLMEKKSDTLKALQWFVDFQYKYRERALNESTKPDVRLVVQPRAKPKYRLHPGINKLTAATKQALAKAIYADGLRRSRRANGKPLSLTDIVLATKEDPKNPFGWSLTEQDKQDIARGVFKKGLYGSSEITLIKRALKDFDAYVRNTIHGRFPDNS